MIARESDQGVKLMMKHLIMVYLNKDRGNLITPRKEKDDIASILRLLRVEAHDKRVDLKEEFKEWSTKDGNLSDTEFRKLIENNDLELSKDDIQKLVDRFINSVSMKIDTNALLANMFKDEDIENSNNKINPPIIVKIAKKIEKKGLSEKIIRNLQRQDRDKNNYLSFDLIREAFHSANFKLSKAQIKEMLEEIRTNSHNEYNYHILLCSLFGLNYEHEIKVPSSSGTPRKIEKDKKRSRSRHKDDHHYKYSDDEYSDRSDRRKTRSGRRNGRSNDHSRK